MADVNMTQSEADALIAMEKRRVDDAEHEFPDLGGELIIPLTSPDGRENFLLDIERGRIVVAKLKFQNRARVVVLLVRLEIAGAPHRNPDGTEVDCHHIHLYREGYGDKWAFPLPREHFTNLTNHSVILRDFMRYCNITQPPTFISSGGGLLS